MKTGVTKRFLAWVIAFLMVFTYVPATAYATDVVDVNTDAEAAAVQVEDETVSEETQEAETVQEETAAESETEVPVAAEPAVELDAVVSDAEEIVESEPAQEPEVTQETEPVQKPAVETITVEEPKAASALLGEIEVLDGKIFITNSDNTGSVENGTVTITAAGTAANHVTVYNETDSEAVIKFDYAAANHSDFSESSESGTYKKVLAAGDSVKLYIAGKADSDEPAVLTLSNFSIEEVADTYDITVEYNDSLGSVTAGGVKVADGETKAVEYAAGLALTAEPVSGAEFLGWIDAKTSEVYSRDAAYTINPTANETVEAVFINSDSEGYYLVADKYIVKGFNTAATKAAATGKKTMVLMNDTTLAAGNYTVPAGVTLLIPFDDAYTLYTDVPKATHDAYKTPVAYRTLKLAEGANLTVNGKLSLSAMHYAANGGGRASGAPTGDVSFVEMEKGSSIVVNDGAYLYAYGYITGEGTVTAKSGATLYENFQIEDFRGGTATSDMAVNEKGVLPMSQYYVQNIEVPTTLEAGAVEYTFTSVFMSSNLFGAAVAFISDENAMFNLTSGNVVKSYDGSTDRLVVEANGNMSLSPITVSLDKNKIDSSQFELPINSNITVEINSGDVEINQDIALLPGAEIIIAEEATCSLNGGANVYVYDADQWGKYCGANNVKLLPVTYAPGRTANRTEADLVDASILVNGTLDASNGFLYTTTTENYELGYGNISSTGKGVVKMVSGEQYCTYQYVQGDSEPYKEIYLLPANLKHSDGTYIQTLDVTVGTYTYTDGIWMCNHKRTDDEVTTEPTCTETGKQHIVCEMGHEYNLTVEALGHDKRTDKAVAATCTTDGKTEGSHCDRCGEVLKAQETIKATGHTEVVDKGINATCITEGLTEGKHCSVCNEVLVKQTVIEATGHAWEVEGKEPTCTVDGYGSSKCKNCGDEIKGDTIPALGHDYKWSVTTEPTCTAAGEETGVCQRTDCGDETTRAVEATGHTFKNYVDNKDATCEAAGTKTAKCENCDATDVKATEPTGHTWKTDNEGNPLYTVDVKPTCTEKGSESVHCEDCDATKDAKDIDALGHTEETIKAVKPTCTETGLTAGAKCSVCGTVTKAQEEVASYGGHKWDKGVVTQIPHMIKNPDTSAKLGVVYESGTRYFACQNDGCKESKTEKVDWQEIKTFDEFMESLPILEDWAFEYAVKNNIEDPAALVIRYVRTGVDRYNSGSWEIMAGVDNTGFTDWVTEKELEINDNAATEADKVNVTGLKNLANFDLPNGEHVDFGHMFGTIDISYTNPTSINHADVAGFFGDTTDLLSTADRFDVRGTVLEMTKEISENYFCVPNMDWDDKFGKTDMLGDLDGYYLNRELLAMNYAKGDLTKLCEAYFTEDLTEKQRAEYYLKNRLQCGTSKAAVRNAVYMAYTGNSVISTLEGTREFKASGDDLADMRKAACYVVADYICKLAGDWTADIDNPYFTVQSEEFYNLAPGITQESKKAVMHTVDKETGNPIEYDMEYYLATVDITRDDVNIYANYPGRPLEKDAQGNYNWSRMTVLEQAKQAQETYGNPESPLYEENYNVIVSTNAEGFEMVNKEEEADDRGKPGGLLIMDGEMIHPIGSNGFFGITKEGKAVMGTTAEYDAEYKDTDKLDEAVGGFGTLMIRDGKITVGESARGGNAPRTAIGVTASGKVVMMVLDGRQQRSVGGDMLEIAHIMLEAGCVDAINLDGGGSSTYVAKMPGDDELSLVNHPSDGYPRAIGSSLLAVSTAKSSTVFDHAELKAPANYMTVGSSMQITASGVTSTGNAVDIPAEATWAVSNDKIATIDKDGNVTALRTGTFDVNLMLDGVSVGQKRINVVIPDTVTFTKGTVDVVYESKVTLPIKAYYEGKAVTVNAGDFDFVVGNELAGKMDGLDFAAGTPDSGLKKVEITATIKGTNNAPAKITVRLYNQGEGTFDFDKKTGGDREFAWLRTVSNATTADNSTYYTENVNKDMEISYTFAIDMTEIPIPPVLEELTDMLPGSNVEGACAWTYLCNLAQRISDTTEVKATVKIDDNYKLVDVNKIDVKNEYFKLTNENGVVYDEENNTVTLTLNWVRQYSPIDLEMADPLCMVTGIRLVPKDDADWGENSTLNIVNEGEVSYDVYMRASSLYTFCNDKSNQEKYGLKPFSRTYVDKDGVTQSEAGGGFGSTYKTFTDSFTLVNAVKNGWIVENGGWAYYKDGDKYTGVQQITQRIDGEMKSLYYDFGEDGILATQEDTYTGFVTDFGLTGTTYSYAIKGELAGGWVQIGEDYHYFDPVTKKALSGKHEITVTARTQSSAIDAPAETITNTVPYELDETGKVMNGGTWFVNDEGKTYFYYGPGFLCRQWGEKDGNTVYFAMAGHLLRGIVRIREDSNRPGMYHMFDEETCAWIQKCEGFVEYNGGILYYPTEEERMAGLWPEDIQDWDAEGDYLKYGRAIGLQQIDGKYYLFRDPLKGEGYGGLMTGKRTVEHDIEGACKTLTFSAWNDGKGGFAVDKNGNPRTDLKHVIVPTPAVEATCSTTGLTEGAHCSECGEVIVAQVEIPVNDDHTVVTDPAVAATCTETGLTEGSHCSACGETIVAQEETPLADHTAVTDAAVPATCTEEGLTEGSHCDVCGEVIVAQEIAPVVAHTPVKDKAVAATCTKAGKTEGSHCSECGEVIKAQKTVAKKAHKAVKDKAVAATCTKAGKTEGSHCSVCKTVIKAQKTVKAKGHKWEKSYTVDKKATTKAPGSKSKHCATCDVKKSGSVVKIAKIKKTTANTLVYNGKKRTGNVTVVNGKGKKLVKGTDFTVTYKNAKGTKVVTPKNVGTYKAVVKFKGQYSGTVTKTFKINPQGTKITKLTNGKKQFTVKWTKKTAQVTGYQLKYSVNKNMKNAKTVTVKNAKTTTKTFKQLKAKKKYYVQIRTYKNVNGTKYYSAWSGKKSVTTKK